MALLQRCLPQCSSQVVLASKLNVKGTRVQSVSQCRPSLVCRAASSSNGSVKASRESAAQTPTVSAEYSTSNLQKKLHVMQFALQSLSCGLELDGSGLFPFFINRN